MPLYILISTYQYNYGIRQTFVHFLWPTITCFRTTLCTSARCHYFSVNWAHLERGFCASVELTNGCLEIATGRLDSKILSVDSSCPPMPPDIRSTSPITKTRFVWRWHVRRFH